MRKLTLDDQQTFNQYLASSHLHWQFQSGFIAIPSAYSFTAHYIWRDFYDFFWVTQNDFFCLFARQDGDYFMPIAPFGSRPLGPDIIEWVFRLMENQSQRTNILRRRSRRRRPIHKFTSWNKTYWTPFHLWSLGKSYLG